MHGLASCNWLQDYLEGQQRVRHFVLHASRPFQNRALSFEACPEPV